MTNEPNLDPYLESLRNALPSRSDEARMLQRLTGAGLMVSVSTATQLAAASTGSATGLAKGALWSFLSTRFLHLPMWAQMGLVTATTTLLATGPVVVVLNHNESRARLESRLVATDSGVPQATRAPKPESTQPPTVAAEATRAVTLEVTSESITLPRPTPVVAKARTQDRELRTENPQPEASSLPEETRLIDAALGAIRNRQFAHAEQLLRVHAERFPNGLLVLERKRAEQKLSVALTNGGS
jgi:hypothetical protein